MATLIKHARAALRPQPAAVMLRLRTLADEIETALGRGGLLSLDDLSTSETGRPTMDLDTAAIIDHLVARWRRYAEYVRANPGQLTPADVYEECADALEARLRSLEIQRQGRGEVTT